MLFGCRDFLAIQSSKRSRKASNSTLASRFELYRVEEAFWLRITSICPCANGKGVGDGVFSISEGGSIWSHSSSAESDISMAETANT